MIPTLNEAEHIETTIASLLDGEEAAADLRVVVMDGGSTDGTHEIVELLSRRYPTLSVHFNAGRTPAAAVNQAASTLHIDRDILIRCDAHALYPPGFLRNVAQTLINQRAESLVVPMDTVPRPGAGLFAKVIAWCIDTPLGAGGSAHRGGAQSGHIDHGHHAGFKRKWFVRLSGYNTDLVANEDAEYDTRLADAGGRIWLDADSRIQYYPRTSLSSLARQYFRYGVGRAQHHTLQKKPLRVRQMIPPLHAMALAVCLGAAPYMGAEALLYPAFYLMALAIGSAYVARKHRRWAGFLSIAPLATIHTAWGFGFWVGLVRARLRRARA